MPQNALAGNFTNNLPDQQADDPVIPVLDARSDSLGKDTNSASTSQQSRKKRYELQRQAAIILPDERVWHCCRSIAPNSEFVQIAKSNGGKTAHFRGLQRCGSVWHCPVCAAQITEHRRQELIKGLANVPYRVVLVTYTLSHHLNDTLKDVLSGMKNAFKFMRSGRKWQDFKSDWKPVGSILSTEVTYGDNGWHPHRHELLFLPEDTDDFDLEIITDELKMLWLKSLEKFGMSADWDHGLDVQTDEDINREYIAKWGHEPMDSGWNVTHELIKSGSKTAHKGGYTPFQLLELYQNGEVDAADLFAEYAECFKGTKQLHWSEGLRGLLGLDDERSDQDIAESEEKQDSDVVITIRREQWKYILQRKQDIRGELLNQALILSPQALWSWLYQKGVPQVKVYNLLDESTW